MGAAGIIVEYNPLHSGHLRLLEAGRAALGPDTAMVCVMSGNFVQRGDFALLRKHARARAAVESGADLVLELPLPWAVSSAEGFAAGGVQALAATGVVEHLLFGSECGDVSALERVAAALLAPSFRDRLREVLPGAVSFAAARQRALTGLLPEEDAALLESPNNILGIEYCKAILHRHTALTPLALPRLGAAHGGGAGAHAGTPMASASFLRGLPQPDWEPFVPARAAELYGRAAADGLLLDGARLETAVLALLRMQDPADFAQVRGVSEGLENRLTAAVREAVSLDDLYTRLKTKRYPHARLRRLVLDAALGFPAELPMPPYLHVLGARKAALPRLKQASLPAATALADLARTGPEAAKISRLHNKAVDFSSLCREKIQPMGLAFTAKPVVI